jgi:hypothetical protein
VNEVTIVATIGVGQAVLRSIGSSPAAQTVAGIGVAFVPWERDVAAARSGLAGLIRVVVEAVG